MRLYMGLVSYPIYADCNSLGNQWNGEKGELQHQRTATTLFLQHLVNLLVKVVVVIIISIIVIFVLLHCGVFYFESMTSSREISMESEMN